MKKILIFVCAVSVIFTFYQLGGERWLLPETYQTLYAESPVKTAAIYFIVYVVVAAFSIPGAGLMTILGGYIFGLSTGIFLVSFASSIGATIAFALSRGLLRDWVTKNFGKYIEGINAGVEKDGAFYLLTLRFIPAIPFFAINLVMGITRMKMWVFYIVSQIGMLPATAIFVNVGSQFGNVDEISAAGILTPGLIGGFVLLATFPLIAKWLMGRIQAARVYGPWKAQKPKEFDTNLIVVGGGSAGLVSAYIAAATQARVTLIEREAMGGDCLNTGCVPSKSLIRSAQIKHYVERAEHFGVKAGHPEIDFPTVMNRVHKVVKDIEPHDSIERYTELGVDCVQGEAELISPWQVKVGDQLISAPNIIIAAGAGPFVPPIPGLEDVPYLTSDNLWQIKDQPKRLLVLGGGPIGCEMAQSFQRLGSEVTMMDLADRILPREDDDVSEFVTERFKNEGMRLLTSHKMLSFKHENGKNIAVAETSGNEVEVEFDQVLIAVGRKARSDTLGFDTLGLEITPRGTLDVDPFLRTKYPNVFACGDVVGPYQFTHTAAHQAWYAAVNALFGKLRKFKVDYSVIPWATFTDPEVAHVGLSEMTAKEQGIEYEVTKYGIDDLDRAIADSEAHGFVKVITPPGKDKILGATIVGYQASNLLAEFVLAMKHGLGLNKILGTIHVYPTLSEANKFTAGEWRKKQVAERTKRWLAKFHSWQR